MTRIYNMIHPDGHVTSFAKNLDGAVIVGAQRVRYGDATRYVVEGDGFSLHTNDSEAVARSLIARDALGVNVLDLARSITPAQLLGLVVACSQSDTFDRAEFIRVGLRHIMDSPEIRELFATLTARLDVIADAIDPAMLFAVSDAIATH